MKTKYKATIHAVTPWTATVQQDISNSETLFETALDGYTLRLHNSGDSIWLAIQWPASGTIAFRLAFGMNSSFERIAVNEISNGLLITASTILGNYRTYLTFPDCSETVLRYTTTFRASQPLLIPFWPRDIVPLTKEGKIENTSGIVHSHQVGGRSGQLFFSYTKPIVGSVFYFQNLTAMSPYCNITETSLAETVGGEWPEIGFQFPVNAEKALPPDQEFTISDAFVLLSEVIPEKDYEKTQQFLNYLAAVYLLLPKPDTVQHDWPAIAEKVLKDLNHNKGCWTQTNSTPYLNAYVCDYKTPAEIMVQLAVLLPLKEYLDWNGTEHQIYDELNSGLIDFYDDNIKSIVRWHPALEDDLDNSEEQKKEMVMDSWYLHHPLLNLSRLALKGDKTAEKLFLDSIGYAIKVARHFDYEWPVFYKMTTLEVIKAETSPGNGGEKDVPGSYAQLMLMAWKLTKDRSYFSEAQKAVRKLDGLAFDIFYQANNTAFAAGALIELYRETNDERYLTLSYSCLAAIFKNVQLWDCNYGHGKNFPNFFAVFPLNDAPYTAAYEELEVYAALHQYLLMADGIPIPDSIRILLPEFIKYTVSRLAYYYPEMLPKEMVSETVKTGEIQQDLWAPLEDMHDGWEQSGEVGQEVYGAGIPFGIVPRQYFDLGESGLQLFTNYPISSLRIGKKSATFRIQGHNSLSCSITINSGKSKTGKISVEQKFGTAYKELQTSKRNRATYEINGGMLTRIIW